MRLSFLHIGGTGQPTIPLNPGLSDERFEYAATTTLETVTMTATVPIGASVRWLFEHVITIGQTRTVDLLPGASPFGEHHGYAIGASQQQLCLSDNAHLACATMRLPGRGRMILNSCPPAASLQRCPAGIFVTCREVRIMSDDIQCPCCLGDGGHSAMRGHGDNEQWGCNPCETTGTISTPFTPTEGLRNEPQLHLPTQ